MSNNTLEAITIRNALSNHTEACLVSARYLMRIVRSVSGPDEISRLEILLEASSALKTVIAEKEKKSGLLSSHWVLCRDEAKLKILAIAGGLLHNTDYRNFRETLERRA